MSQPPQTDVDRSPPYPPQHQELGEIPSILPDVPLDVIFLLLFVLGAAGHMFVLKFNERRGKKFIINGMIFGFCITRILATIFRLAWACHPRSVRLGMAAMICLYAGIVLLFLANLIFAERILRAQHPHVGWSKPVSIGLPALFVVIIATIICLIVTVILEFYSLKSSVQRAARVIQCYGATLYAVVSFLPVIIVGISTLARAHPSIKHTRGVDKFGKGTMRSKVAIVIFSGCLLCLGASYRAGTTLLAPVPTTEGSPPQPAPHPAYFSKAAFYIFNFTIEIFITYFWLFIRIDKRFHIPNGAKGPFSYGSGFTFAGEPGNEKSRLGQIHGESMVHLTGSRASTFTSRTSRSSMAKESRVSWGGLSYDDIALAYAEDGTEVMPYSAFDPTNNDDNELFVDGAQEEMGWDSKTGNWALRPISSMKSSASLRSSMASQKNAHAMARLAHPNNSAESSTRSVVYQRSMPLIPLAKPETYRPSTGSRGSGSGSGQSVTVSRESDTLT